jgi:DNA-binding phage protein
MTPEAVDAARSLMDSGGNLTEVARVMGIARSTLVDALGRSAPATVGSGSNVIEIQANSL